MEDNVKSAVLIDAENAQPSIVDELMVEVANYGTASVKFMVIGQIQASI